MPVYYVHVPYMEASRQKLAELLQAGSAFTFVERWTAQDDARWTLIGGHLSYLPSLLLLDDDHKTELCRTEHLDHITPANVEWMHQAHAEWKAGGKKPGTFAIPPWGLPDWMKNFKQQLSHMAWR